MTKIEITHITIITTTLIIVVFRFSYLHSHLKQNCCSFPKISLPILGRITPSQLLKRNQTAYILHYKKRTQQTTYHLFGGTFVMYNILDVRFLVSVLFVTDDMLGQMHLHLLSS